MRRWRGVWHAAGLGLACLLSMHAGAVPAVPESELKAAYLYNFALFTAWPADKMQEGEAVHFCMFGQSPVLAALNALQSRKIRDRRIAVKQVATPEEGRACHVLYFGLSDAEAATRMLEGVRDSGTLTVSDLTGVRPETVIALVLENDRLLFDVNLLSARRARLTLSSKLLKLARSVN